MSNLDLAHKALQASEAGDVATLGGMVTDDFQFLGVTPMPLGKAEFIGFIQSLHTAFPDFKFNLLVRSAIMVQVTYSIQQRHEP